ncbi:MAG TPA: HU family DNA-binding protein [Verrucomicrobiae bacterium]|nr:HU family DNA-binding protein [Verrucomicrobiae bacterium]
MTKAELVAEIAEASGISRAAAEKVVKAFTDAVVETLKKGEKLTIVGFGTFEVGERGERTGRNPQSGEEIKIAASKSPKFRPGKALKDAIAAK